MVNNKKAMELSMNTIVIAVAVLLVLVVVLVVFGGRMGFFTTSLDQCSERGGCVMNEDQSVTCVQNGGSPMKIKWRGANGDQVATTKICCLNLNKEARPSSCIG